MLWATVRPFADQFSVAALYRLTYSALPSALVKYTESWYLVALSMPVPSQQVVPCLGV